MGIIAVMWTLALRGGNIKQKEQLVAAFYAHPSRPSHLHSPFLLAVFGHVAGKPASLSLALIWIAHICFDRMLGFGCRFENTLLSGKRHRGDSVGAAVA